MKRPAPDSSGLPVGPLPLYSGDEVRLWNWFCRAFGGGEDWRGWILDVASRVLSRQVGQELIITQSHRSQPGNTEFRFDKPEVRFGRGTENDVVLSGSSISKHHTRLFVDAGKCFVEDLGSLLGTYVNGNKLAPRQAAPVRSGDQLVIFPYVFSLKIAPVWAPETNVRLDGGTTVPSSWSAFLKGAPIGFANFFITAYPGELCAGLQIDRSFVRSLQDRALSADGAGSAPDSDAGAGVLASLALGVVQHANQRLASPFQLALTAVRPEYEREERGIVLTSAVRLSTDAGAFRIFLPYSFLTGVSGAVPGEAHVKLPQTVTWAFPISAGTLALSIGEIRRLESGDVVIFDNNPQLLFPKNFKKGWKISFEGDNFSKAALDKWFEGETIVGNQVPETEKGGDSADLGSLPVLLHVIIGEKEMTLSEANGLAPGTILDLQRDLSSVVQLAVNGRIVGQGKLVEIDGKLGVRIGTWRA